MEITLPKEGENIQIETTQSIVILGANGSGKTRLGTWIELKGPQKDKTYRIGAQKSLTFPDNIPGISSFDIAEKDLLFGYNNQNATIDHRQGQKWGGKPETFLINDYHKLLNLLFAQYNSESARYREEAKLSSKKPKIINTRLDTIKKIRDKVLPHRELIISGNTIKTKVTSIQGDEYNASNMSDGERVMFYLIGHCLCAPVDSIIIIDEPELHLHKSIQILLRNEIEKERKDCSFIYLTHDIDFAASKHDSKKIRLKSFDGTKWEWQEYEDIAGVPEELQLEIIGTRQKVLFVEGDTNSLDNNLYRIIFQGFLIKPCGGCKNVINYTKAFRENTQFANMEFYGLIDKDRRNDTEVNSLKTKGVYVLSVAEIENIFIVPELLNIISEIMLFKPDEKIEEVKSSIVNYLSKEKDTQISIKMAEEIKSKLNIRNPKSNSISDLKNSMNELTTIIDLPELEKNVTTMFEEIIKDKNYTKLLEIYNRKNLVNRIAPIFTLQERTLQQLIIRSLGDEKYNEKIINGVKKYIPTELTDKIKVIKNDETIILD